MTSSDSEDTGSEDIELQSATKSTSELIQFLELPPQPKQLIGDDKETLKSLYLQHHQTDTSLNIFYECVRDCQDYETKEQVMDIAWETEVETHHGNGLEAATCLKTRIQCNELKAWIFDQRDRGIFYKMRKGLDQSLTRPFLHCAAKAVKCCCRSDVFTARFFSCVFFCIGIVYSALAYVKIFKDIMTTFILRHYSVNILVSQLLFLLTSLLKMNHFSSTMISILLEELTSITLPCTFLESLSLVNLEFLSLEDTRSESTALSTTTPNYKRWLHAFSPFFSFTSKKLE